MKKKINVNLDPDSNDEEIQNRITKSGTMVKKNNFKISDSIKMRAKLFEKKNKKDENE